MLEFKKYSSIENSFNREFMERIVAEMPFDMEYFDLFRLWDFCHEVTHKERPLY